MKLLNKNSARKVLRVVFYACAFVGGTFIFVFIAMQFGWLNVRGAVSERNSYFSINLPPTWASGETSELKTLCQINTLSKYAPLTSVNLYKTYNKTQNNELIRQMLEVASRRYENNSSFIESMNDCNTSTDTVMNVPTTAYMWADTDQWNLMKEVFIRDQDIIKKAAFDAHISPRLILAGVIGEQFRFFNNSGRESFKTYFEPLKILASLSKISYGIAGLKPKTIGQIEEHLKDPTSPFYLGSDMEHVVDYPIDADIESEQMNRITNAKDPYYSYLYVGLFMKEIEAQWKKAGYNIHNRPEILATLYNLGFFYSVPKIDPQPGGAIISLNGTDYTFGDLGYEFYYSGELSDTFPLDVQ